MYLCEFKSHEGVGNKTATRLQQDYNNFLYHLSWD